MNELDIEDYMMQCDEDFPCHVDPLSVHISAAQNGFVVTTSGGSAQSRTYIASTLERAQSILIQHLNSGA